MGWATVTGNICSTHMVYGVLGETRQCAFILELHLQFLDPAQSGEISSSDFICVSRVS